MTCAVAQVSPACICLAQGAAVLATIQTAVTLVFAPSVCFYIVTIMTDCTANSPHGSYVDLQVRCFTGALQLFLLCSATACEPSRHGCHLQCAACLSSVSHCLRVWP